VMFEPELARGVRWGLEWNKTPMRLSRALVWQRNVCGMFDTVSSTVQCNACFAYVVDRESHLNAFGGRPGIACLWRVEMMYLHRYQSERFKKQTENESYLCQVLVPIILTGLLGMPGYRRRLGGESIPVFHSVLDCL